LPTCAGRAALRAKKYEFLRQFVNYSPLRDTAPLLAAMLCCQAWYTFLFRNI
jgi:hypothetical protein